MARRIGFQIHFPKLVRNRLIVVPKHLRGYCMTYTFRVDVFQVKIYLASFAFKFFTIVVRIRRLILIAENIQNLRILTWFDVAVAAIRPQV